MTELKTKAALIGISWLAAVAVYFLSGNSNLVDRLVMTAIAVLGASLISFLCIRRPLSETRVRYTAVVLAMAVPLMLIAPPSLIELVVEAIRHAIDWTLGLFGRSGTAHEASNYITEIDSDKAIAVLAALVITVIALVCVFFSAPRSASSATVINVSKIIPDIAERDILRNLIKAHIKRVEQLNSVAHWDPDHFVPLDVAVQLKSARSIRNRPTSLSKSIQKLSGNDTIVVVGDPGSGKSVGLRQYALTQLQQLEKQPERRQLRIPIFVDLKEWKIPKGQELDSQLLLGEFREFCLRSFAQGLTELQKDFLDRNFDIMCEAGMFQFICDSFDEIPAILDSDETSDFVNILATTIASFGSSGGSICIIASRPYRRPRIEFGNISTLDVLPFGPGKIARVVRAAVPNGSRLLSSMFGDRIDLYQIATNPFRLKLIIEYFRRNSGMLPNGQIDIYQDFVTNRIAGAINELGVSASVAEVTQLASDTSNNMFEHSEHGLSIQRKELVATFNNPRQSESLRVLEFAGIIRTSLDGDALSFSHRRLQEFFVVSSLLSAKQRLPLDSIQEDGRWREPLVLLCEVAPNEVAKVPLNHAWQYAKRIIKIDSFSGTNEEFQSVSALRFMTAAFRTRKDIVASIKDEINVIPTVVFALGPWSERMKGGFIIQKLCVEFSILLREELSLKVITSCLYAPGSWLRTAALEVARQLPKLPEEIEQSYLEDLNGGNRVSSALRFIESGWVLRFSPNLSRVYQSWRLSLLGAVLYIFLSFGILCAASYVTSSFTPLAIIAYIIISYLLVVYVSYRFQFFANLDLRIFESAIVWGIYPLSLYWAYSLPIDYMYLNGPLLYFVLTLVGYITLTLVNHIKRDSIANRVLSVARFWRTVLRGPFHFSLSSSITDTADAIRKSPYVLAHSLRSNWKSYLMLTFPVGIFYAVDLLWDLDWISGLLLGILAAAFVIIGASLLVYWLTRWMKAKKRLSEIKSNFLPNRQYVAEAFSELHDLGIANKFVTWLEENRQTWKNDFENRENQWPQGGVPNYGDVASEHLARLDAFFWGLD